MLPKKQENLDLALKIAWEKLATRDLKDVCERSGARYLGPNEVALQFLNRAYSINLDEQDIHLSRSGDDVQTDDTDVSTKRCVLLLHYLLNSVEASSLASSTPYYSSLRNPREIGFAQMPGAAGYLGPFRGRVIGRILGMFGERPEMMLKCGELIGGESGGFGDVSEIVSPFPKVAITFVLWRGDEELPPEGNVLFNETVYEYLSVEDVVVTCEEIVGELSSVKKKF